MKITAAAVALSLISIAHAVSAAVPDACETSAYNRSTNESVHSFECGTSFAPGAPMVFGHAGNGIAEAQAGYGFSGSSYCYDTVNFLFYRPPSAPQGDAEQVRYVLTLRVEGLTGPGTDADAGIRTSSNQELQPGEWEWARSVPANTIVSHTIYARANAPDGTFESYRRITIDPITYEGDSYLMAGGRFGDAISTPEPAGGLLAGLLYLAGLSARRSSLDPDGGFA